MKHYNSEDPVCELAEQILKVKRAYAENPELYRAAAKKLLDDAKLVKGDKDLKKAAAEEPAIKAVEIEVVALDEAEGKKSIKEKMEDLGKKKS